MNRLVISKKSEKIKIEMRWQISLSEHLNYVGISALSNPKIYIYKIRQKKQQKKGTFIMRFYETF